jgi:hypothetical protein
MWTRSCLSISCFLSLLCPLSFLQKVWTGRRALKILKKRFYLSLLESVDMWTRSCLSISCFLSFLYPLKYLQKVWTGGQALNILEKKSTSCISLFKNVDMWTRSCFSISCFLSFLVSFKIMSKSVDKWTSNENFENLTACM